MRDVTCVIFYVFTSAVFVFMNLNVFLKLLNEYIKLVDSN